MYFLVNVDRNSTTVHLTRSDCEEFKKCCISNAVEGTDDDMWWNGSEEDGYVRTVRKIKALTEDEDSDTDW